MKQLRIRNRQITDDSLTLIRATIAQHWTSGRTAISRKLCEKWDWRQPNGQYKEMACRELLLRLEEKQLIQLPPRIWTTPNHRKIDPVPESLTIERAHPLAGRIDSYRHIDLELCQNRSQRRFWDSVVDEYHYLGCKHIVGSCLKYLVYLDHQLAGCIGWGSAAWRVGCRDQFIGWTDEQRRQNLNRMANHVRFLILPWVKVTHFASKLLALSVKILKSDWERQFDEEVIFLETFVDGTRFHGTCYRAANWLYLGETKGSGKRGASYHQHGIIKSVFVYPLTSGFRERLCR